MSAQQTLMLRDVHVPPTPSWWPPAIGWWLVLLAIVLLIGFLCAWVVWKRARRRRWLKLFETECNTSLAPTAQIAAASQLLRRAARRVDAEADRLNGEKWLQFLDGKKGLRKFSAGPGALLLDGGYRPQVDASQLEQLRNLARERFMQLMERRR